MGENNKVSAPKVSDWMIERLAKGELDPATAGSVRARLAAELGGDAAVTARLQALAEDDQATLGRLPAALVVPKIRLRADEAVPARRRAPARRRLVWLSPLAAAALALFVYVGTKGPGASTGTFPAGSPADEEPTTTKGSARLLAFRAASLAGTKVEQLGADAAVRPHDLLQLAYTAGEARFGVVVSVDGGGGVTQHLPAAPGRTAAALSSAGAVRLPNSYELDESPGFERFFLVTAAKPFPTEVVIAAAAQLAKTPGARSQPLALSAEFFQESLLLKKVTP